MNKTNSPVEPDPARRGTALRRSVRRTMGLTRLIAIIPAFGFFIAALVLAIGAFASVVRVAVEFA